MEYHRWFLLPIEEYQEDGETIRAPKYVYDEDRLDGYSSGGPFSWQEVDEAGYSHALAFNDALEWRVVLAYGEGYDAWDALNEIHSFYHDSITLADHDNDVAPVMDERFGAGEWTIGWSSYDKSDNTI